MKSNKNIFKHAALDDVYPNIAPSKTFIPDWYKKKDRFGQGIKKVDTLPIPLTFKACSAFSDSFIAGYMMPLAVDVAVKQTEGGPSVSWAGQNPNIIECRGLDSEPAVPTPLGCSDIQFAWQTKHTFAIPKGYSAFVTHPLNRHDLPFVTLSGIIDGEMVVHKGNIPFYLSSNFEGLIPAGTPIMQIMLFKTEDWHSKNDLSIIEEAYKNEKRTTNAAFGWYKKNIWKKKTYD